MFTKLKEREMPHEPCPAKCGKIFISKEHAERHADMCDPEWRTPRQRGWSTPYGFCDFSKPVTYEEACELMKQMTDKCIAPKHSFGGACDLEDVMPKETVEKIRKFREDL